MYSTQLLELLLSFFIACLLGEPPFALFSILFAFLLCSVFYFVHYFFLLFYFFQYFFCFILGEPPFALRGFEAVSSDHHIFLLLFFFWLCNPYAGISGLILFVFTDLDIYFVCFILADPPKVPRSLRKI